MPDFVLEQRSLSPVIGIDEAGCGPWAGPVVAAAFAFLDPAGINAEHLKLISDSKQLSVARREMAYTQLISWPDTYYGIGYATVEEIDRG